MTTRRWFPAACGLAAAAMFGLPQVQAQEGAAAAAAAQPGVQVEVRQGGPVGGGEYWIGVVLRPLDELTRSQLKLEEGQGVAVEQVADGAPASAAGLKQHDILIKSGDKNIGNHKDLYDVVEGSDGEEITLEVLRGGEIQSIAVTPEKREESDVAGRFFLLRGARDADVVRRWAERLAPPDVRRVGPGVVVGVQAHALPDGVTVTVTRTGNDPANIVVKRGDEKWEITEDEFDELPEDLREPVRQMVRGGGIHVDALKELDLDVRVPRVRVRGLGPRGVEIPGLGLPGHVEKRLEEMNERLKKLTEEVEKLRDEQ